VRYRNPGGRWLWLPVPVVPVVVVLSPLLLLAVLAGLVMCHVYRVSPAGALRGASRLLWAMPGARVEIDDGQTALLISVR
ncbi:MAG: hypothetical protein ACRDNW_13805, partial [Trebonia sp.]